MRRFSRCLFVVLLAVTGCGKSSKPVVGDAGDAGSDGQRSDATASIDGGSDAAVGDVGGAGQDADAARQDSDDGSDAIDGSGGRRGDAPVDMGTEVTPVPTCGSPGCFAPAGPLIECVDGSFVGPVCEGNCQWVFPACPPVVCPSLSCANTCPLGRHVDSKGCSTCDCYVHGDCGAHADASACVADVKCRWLEPGCGTVALQKAGCFPRTDLDCTNGSCSGGRQCVWRTVNTCGASDAGASDGGTAVCTTCDVSESICF